MGLLTDDGCFASVPQDRLGRHNHGPRRPFMETALLVSVFPEVGKVIADAPKVPVSHMTATGVVCVCGEEREVGRNETVPCECGRWFSRISPDEIRACRPGTIEDD